MAKKLKRPSKAACRWFDEVAEEEWRHFKSCDGPTPTTHIALKDHCYRFALEIQKFINHPYSKKS